MVRGIASVLAATLLSGGGFVSGARAAGGNDPHQRTCDKTSQVVRTACDAEATDDLWIAKGTCANVADAESRNECLSEARMPGPRGAKSVEISSKHARISAMPSNKTPTTRRSTPMTS
jgi:hypothetical protein